MAVLSFPLDLDTFLRNAQVSEMSFSPQASVEISRTAGGDVLRADVGSTLWRGSVALKRRKHVDMAEIEVLLSVLDRPGASFLAYDARYPYPRYDFGGVTLGASTVQILALDADQLRMSLKGLPAGYVLTRGQKLSFQYGSSPVRYALHQMVDEVTADGSGETALFEVSPPIRPGAATDAAVGLVRPSCKAVIVPGRSEGSGGRTFTDGVQFDFVQTLR